MTTRRGFLAATGGTAVALAGCVDGGDEGIGTVGSPTPPPDSPVTTAPIPDDPGSFDYATMGTGDGPTVTYFGNWKCPFCAEFSRGFLGDIVTDYVEPGTLDLRYRALSYFGDRPFLGPDAPRAARAGLAVWNVDPEAYWPYHELVMANQPPESQEWATVDRLAAYAEAAGVSDVDTVRSETEADTYESLVSDTSDAASEAGVESTPSLVIGDSTINPLGDESRVRSLLDQFADGA